MFEHHTAHMSAVVRSKIERARNMAYAGDFRGARAIKDQLNANTTLESTIAARIVGIEIAKAILFQHPSLRATAQAFEEGR